MKQSTILRCFGTGDPLYEAYHDDEWGQPLTDSDDEQDLFERLALEGFQSGLSWLTVLRKRDAFREAFAGFQPAEVAAFTNADIARLLSDERIIRNRAKITATIGNARVLLALHDEGERLADWFVEYAPEPRQAPTADQVRSQTPETVALSKKLRSAGFRFVGPVTVYSTMQAIGLVDDHLADCWKARGQ